MSWSQGFCIWWGGCKDNVTWLWNIVSWLTTRVWLSSSCSTSPLPPHHHCYQISTVLFWGSKGEARTMPLQHLQMCQSWAGRSCFRFHILLGTRVKKLNRSAELGQRNTKHVDTSGKITKWSCQQALKQEGFFYSLHLITYVFLVQKIPVCLWEIMLKALGKMHLHVFLFTTQRAVGSFCFWACASAPVMEISQMHAVKQTAAWYGIWFCSCFGFYF